VIETVSGVQAKDQLALTKRIKIIITDNGKGMDASFVREKLGEPWAKEDPYATGSGKGAQQGLASS
jgi:nitrogen fixation/metabolism regulation signal transduction histidine kinase